MNNFITFIGLKDFIEGCSKDRSRWETCCKVFWANQFLGKSIWKKWLIEKLTISVSIWIAADLLRAENVGKKLLKKFIAGWVDQTMSFYAPLQKNESKSFKELWVYWKNKGKGKTCYCKTKLL